MNFLFNKIIEEQNHSSFDSDLYKEQYRIQVELTKNLNGEQLEMLYKLMDVNFAIVHSESKSAFKLGCTVGANLVREFFI